MVWGEALDSTWRSSRSKGQHVQEEVGGTGRDHRVVGGDVVEVDARLDDLLGQLGVGDHPQRVDEQDVRPGHLVEQFQGVDDVLTGLDRVVDDDVVGRRDVVLGRERGGVGYKDDRDQHRREAEHPGSRACQSRQ